MAEEVFDESKYIKMSSGSVVSRGATLVGPQNIEIQGKVIVETDVLLRGDMAPVQIDRYSKVCKGSVLRPSGILPAGGNGKLRFIPLTIGKYTLIGDDCVVECASVGAGCYIGQGSVLCTGAILKDYVHVEPGTIVPPDLVIPPFSIVSGQPARCKGEAPVSLPDVKEHEALQRYKRFMRGGEGVTP